MCRRTWLLGIHIEASRFRRKAHDLNTRLNDRLNDGLKNRLNDRLNNPHTNVTSGRAITSSALTSGPTNVPSYSQWQRPATSMDFRRTDLSECRPQAGRSRSRTSVLRKADIREKPLFKVRGGNKVVNNSSSDEDNAVDSEEDSLTYVSDETDGYRHIATVKDSNALFCLKRPASKAKDIKREGTSSRKQSALQRTHSIQETSSKTSPQRETTTATGRTNSNPLIHLRSVSSLGRITSREREGNSAPNGAEESWKRRAQTAMGSPRRRGPGPGPAPSTPCCEAGSFRDADYMRLVLDLERDKYEISQMKVRTYLQNLKI